MGVKPKILPRDPFWGNLSLTKLQSHRKTVKYFITLQLRILPISASATVVVEIPTVLAVGGEGQ